MLDVSMVDLDASAAGIADDRTETDRNREGS